MRQALAENAQVDIGDVSFTSIGPTWGDEITRKALRALVFFFIAITLYITIRFEWRMAVAALAAVVHDVLISVGVYSIFGFEVSPATVIAFLTILGFSLYDTIVVFDKVHENSRRILATGRATYGDVVNLSMNQVMARSLNTSICAVLPVLSLLIVGSIFMGATALQGFSLALLVGLITGAYSSIFIATPILAVLKEREPRYRALKERYGSTTILSTLAGGDCRGDRRHRRLAGAHARSCGIGRPGRGVSPEHGRRARASPAPPQEEEALARRLVLLAPDPRRGGVPPRKSVGVRSGRRRRPRTRSDVTRARRRRGPLWPPRTARSSSSPDPASAAARAATDGSASFHPSMRTCQNVVTWVWKRSDSAAHSSTGSSMISGHCLPMNSLR